MTQVIVSQTAIVGPRPVVGWRNLLLDGAVTFSSEEDENPHENAFDDIGTDYWRPEDSGQQWLEVEFSGERSADYIAVSRHTMHGAGVSFRLQYWDGGWVNAHSVVTPGNDDVVLVLFDTVSSTRFRFLLNGSGRARIGDVRFGERLTFERGIFLGHVPEKLNRSNRLVGRRTEAGVPLPRSIIRQGVESEISVDNLSASFVFEHWEPFARHAETSNFVWAWNPAQYPEQVLWAWPTADGIAEPSRVGGPQSRGLWQVSMPIKGVFR